MAKRKCKNCGRVFETTNSAERFCSAVCRTTGLFVGGGGDTSKPSAQGAVNIPKRPRPQRVAKTETDYPRVRILFSLPYIERWEYAKTLTEEEMNYAHRMARRMLAEERRFATEWSWEEQDDTELARERGLAGGTIGESDDGST